MSSNVSYIPNGTLPLFAQRIDNLTNIVYVATAPIGSLDSDAVWSIRRITFTGTLVVTEWADGNELNDNVWTDRATLSYS